MFAGGRRMNDPRERHTGFAVLQDQLVKQVASE
jgi:hypothetical protein